MIGRGQNFDYLSNLVKVINTEPNDVAASRKALAYEAENADKVSDSIKLKNINHEQEIGGEARW